MNSSKRHYFRNALLLATFLLLGNPFPANSFQQNAGQAGMSESGKTGGITMMEVSGKVVETMTSGGYSYALVDKDGVKTWVALPKSRIAVGDEIACRSGMVMKNFRSTSLNRIFEQIVFSPGLTSTTGAAANPGETASPDEALEEPKPKPPEDWKNF
jgi:hypothetical protein